MCIRDSYTWPGNVRQLKNSLYRALTPVSYTHLDVYKRQLYLAW
ncbi:AAA-type ATPase lid domain-containing protein [Erwinia amylovora]